MDDAGDQKTTDDQATVAAGAEAGRWVTTEIGRDRFRSEVRARTHVLVLDEPVAVGGTDLGATPYEALLAALGGCTAMTLRMYADRKRWPLERVRVRLRTSNAHEADCEACETSDVGPQQVESEIELEGPLDDQQRTRLLQIAARCPVKQTLERGFRVVPHRP
jgi:putative redox protein